MTNVRTVKFKEMLAALPHEVRAQALLAYKAFLVNPAAKALRVHELKDTHRGKHRAGSK